MKITRTQRINARITAAEHSKLAERARAEGVRPAELARRLYAYAMANMPKGWKP